MGEARQAPKAATQERGEQRGMRECGETGKAPVPKGGHCQALQKLPAQGREQRRHGLWAKSLLASDGTLRVILHPPPSGCLAQLLAFPPRAANLFFPNFFRRSDLAGEERHLEATGPQGATGCCVKLDRSLLGQMQVRH